MDDHNKKVIERFFADLSPRERDLMRLRFGLDQPRKTMEEVAVLYGWPIKKVRNMEELIKQRLMGKGWTPPQDQPPDPSSKPNLRRIK